MGSRKVDAANRGNLELCQNKYFKGFRGSSAVERKVLDSIPTSRVGLEISQSIISSS